MNISLIISTIVGGLLMLSLIGLNTRVTQNAGIKTMQFATKSKVESLSGYLTADLRQVGAGITSGNKIEQITSNMITFRYYMVNLKYDKTGRGILLVTFASAAAYFFLYL